MKKLLLSALAAVFLAPGSAMAQWTPSGPINMWVAFGAGGVLDTVSRVIAQELRTQTGWQVVVENVPAGGGMAMLSRLSAAPANGLSIGMAVNMPIIVNMTQRPAELPFTLDSFDYLGSVVVAEKGLYAMADAPFSNVAEMLDHAREHGLVIAAAPGPDTALTQALIAETGGAIRHLPAESGAQALTYILGGHAQVSYGGGEHLQYFEDGVIRMLASVNSARLSYAPEIPTMLEQGFDFYIDPFFFLVAPRGLPAEVHEALVAAVDAAVQSDAVREVVLSVIRNEVENFGPEGTRARLEAGLAEMGPMFR